MIHERRHRITWHLWLPQRADARYSKCGMKGRMASAGGSSPESIELRLQRQAPASVPSPAVVQAPASDPLSATRQAALEQRIDTRLARFSLIATFSPLTTSSAPATPAEAGAPTARVAVPAPVLPAVVAPAVQV
jgi:hypothetical protein